MYSKHNACTSHILAGWHHSQRFHLPYGSLGRGRTCDVWLTARYVATTLQENMATQRRIELRSFGRQPSIIAVILLSRILGWPTGIAPASSPSQGDILTICTTANIWRKNEVSIPKPFSSSRFQGGSRGRPRYSSIWYQGRDSNSQNLRSKLSMYANSITLANLVGHLGFEPRLYWF